MNRFVRRIGLVALLVPAMLSTGCVMYVGGGYIRATIAGADVGIRINHESDRSEPAEDQEAADRTRSNQSGANGRRSNMMMPMAMLSVLVPLYRIFPGSAEHGYFDSDGVKIHYTVQGEGEPVVLIHGLTASAMLNWRMPGITKALAEDYRVIAVDVRGHGRSGKPHDPGQYDTEMAEDIVRLLDHLDIPRAHVVGYSMGGMITMKLIALHPERLLSATVGGAGWTWEGSETQSALTELAESLDAGKGFAPLFRALTPEGRPEPSRVQMWVINAVVGGMNDVEALAAVVRGMRNLTVTEEELRANKVPTLALIGEMDTLKQTVEPMEGVMSNLEVRVIDGADHLTAIADETFMKSLGEFLIAHSANSQN